MPTHESIWIFIFDRSYERFEKQDGLPILEFSLKFFEEAAKFKVIFGQDSLKESGFSWI